MEIKPVGIIHSSLIEAKSSPIQTLLQKIFKELKKLLLKNLNIS